MTNPNDLLARAKGALAAHVARGALPGAVMLLAERGEVHVESLGALRRDAIFRISSMTKPITAAATMVLVDEGKLRLDEPASRLLPELANRRVLKSIDGPLDDTVPAARAISVRDLLTFTMGFGIVWGPQDALPIQRAADALDLAALGPPKPDKQPPPDEWMRRFSSLPLMCQPGERWLYNTGSELLGVLVARAAEKPFDTFLRERVLEPLGMKDTSFSVPPEKRARLPESYLANPTTGALEPYADFRGTHAPAFPSGAAGLMSTVDDYHAFARMLLDGGGRVLSRASALAMTQDQLTAAQRVDGSLDPEFWRTRTWGFGLSVITRASDLHPEGAYGWDGGLGTSWYTHPQRGTIGILMTQRSEYPYFAPVHRDFWSNVRRA
jgi:CubicO group peptidase (beta-lactamase class C family)